ncbi:6-phosphogluconolactonase [Neptunicoccus cionae]|uniref:6-phosphogluconolactonase n=1 Tax=Neptunicoccus cionae TaxID=2035344 RepID=A0A916QXY3_9RHOB|nr:6-phosphogluconolactonase [Amylibacter cionae]GGA20762.1 6-phosphogluconolactonase [Amylibacter cionae]
MSDFITYDSRDALFQGLAGTVEEQLRAALAAKGTASLAVPGGTTPAPFFHRLRKADLNWANVRVMLTDERFVPEGSERSNTRLLREHLLQDNAAAATLVPFYQLAEAPEDVLDSLRDAIEAALPLDVCVLGMGADMHTASIFPEADLLAEALDPQAPILLPMRAPNAPEPRLTLTAPVLQAAKAVHILIAGADKKTAFARAQSANSPLEAPIRIVQEQAITHYAD